MAEVGSPAPGPTGEAEAGEGETPARSGMSSRVDPHWARWFALQLAIAALSVTAIQATRPMVTYRAIGLGAGPLEIGLVQSAFSILPVFTAVALGRWVDRIGEARFLIAGMAIISVGSLVATTAGTLVVLAISQSIMGFGQITNLVAGQTMIANRGPREGREQRYGWYSTVASLGQLAGPAIAAFLVGGTIAAGAVATDPDGPLSGIFADNPEAPVFLFSATVTGIAFVLALFLPRRRPRPPDPGTTTGRTPSILSAAATVLRRPGMAAAMLVSITVISSVDVLIAYLPVYGEATGLPVETVGLLLSVRAASSMVSRLFMAQLIALLGRNRLLAASMLMAGAGILSLPFIGSVPVLFGVMILIGLGLGLGQPMTIAWVANRSPRQERALALGVRLTGNRGALLIVPSLMGAIAGVTGVMAIWGVMAIVLGAGAVVAARTPFDALVRRPRGEGSGGTT